MNSKINLKRRKKLNNKLKNVDNASENIRKNETGTNMQFRKKPVVIEANQWFKLGDHPNVKEYNYRFGWIETLEGGHIVYPGDWIITGVKGEQYPCKPDIFELTYEPI